MNKQGAIEKIKYMDTLNINDRITNQKVDMVIKNQVLDIISQIDEPQKVVIPKFVAEWLEENDWRKDTSGMQTIFDAFDNLTLDASNGFYVDVKKWVEENRNIFTQAWVFGYEIEPEKLYTVEIPDPHGIYRIRYLFKNSDGNIRIGGSDCMDMLLNAETHLTESEIKKDFEWAWQWAKEVE